ncbi:MAG: lyase family protein, partial [Solirubrobacteraceae bacterium]
LLRDARAAAEAAATLADAHRATAMIGRTLLQQALPTTFGLRAAGWLVGIDEAVAELARVRDRRLAVQMGGPVGARGPAIAARVAADLELVEPVLPWQAIRVRPAALAAALGGLCGVLAKVARDVTLLAQQEVGEVREGGGPGRGGSSAMAHKRNPVGAVSVLACAKRAPGLVATMLACMEQEHERAAGAWQAEWGVEKELLALAGSAAAWARELLEGLEVDGERMRANLAAAVTGDEPLPEGAGELIDRALAAHRAAGRAAGGIRG